MYPGDAIPVFGSMACNTGGKVWLARTAVIGAHAIC
jgi:hypothetical protein